MREGMGGEENIWGEDKTCVKVPKRERLAVRGAGCQLRWLLVMGHGDSDLGKIW